MEFPILLLIIYGCQKVVNNTCWLYKVPRLYIKYNVHNNGQCRYNNETVKQLQNDRKIIIFKYTCYITGTSAVLDLYDWARGRGECAWYMYNKFMFQWSHTAGITVHAQYVPRKHAEQVARVCTAVASAAGQVCYADNMEAKY